MPFLGRLLVSPAPTSVMTLATVVAGGTAAVVIAVVGHALPFFFSDCILIASLDETLGRGILFAISKSYATHNIKKHGGAFAPPLWSLIDHEVPTPDHIAALVTNQIARAGKILTVRESRTHKCAHNVKSIRGRVRKTFNRSISSINKRKAPILLAGTLSRSVGSGTSGNPAARNASDRNSRNDVDTMGSEVDDLHVARLFFLRLYSGRVNLRDREVFSWYSDC